MQQGPGYVVLRAFGGRYPDDGLCRIVAPPHVDGPNYDLDVSLYNVEAAGGPGAPSDPGLGSPGVLFNIMDVDNAEFIVFRLRSESESHSILSTLYRFKFGYKQKKNNTILWIW